MDWPSESLPLVPLVLRQAWPEVKPPERALRSALLPYDATFGKLDLDIWKFAGTRIRDLGPLADFIYEFLDRLLRSGTTWGGLEDPLLGAAVSLPPPDALGLPATLRSKLADAIGCGRLAWDGRLSIARLVGGAGLGVKGVLTVSTALEATVLEHRSQHPHTENAVGASKAQEVHLRHPSISTSTSATVRASDADGRIDAGQSSDAMGSDYLAQVTPIPIEPINTAGILEVELEKLTRRAAGLRWQAIWRRFGFDGRGGCTLEEAGRHSSVTRERVRQIERRVSLRIRFFSTPSLLATVRDALAHLTACAERLHPDPPRSMIDAGLTRIDFLPKGILLAAELLRIPHNLVIGADARTVRLRGDQLVRPAHAIARTLSHLNYVAHIDRVVQRLRQRQDPIATRIDHAGLRQLLAAHPAVVWLDSDRTWFWVKQKEGRNRLENRLRKALSVGSRLSIEDAHEAVFRGPRAGSNPLPIEVFASFARAAGFLVQNGRVESPQELDPAVELSGSELHLFAALSAIGGIGSYQEVRSLCLEQGMNLHTFSGYMSWSPIVKRVAPGTWALVGAETEPPGRVRETSKKLTGHETGGARAGRVHGSERTRVARRDRSSRAVRRSDSTRSYARPRAFHSHGRTPEGAVWIAFNATDGLRRTGLFALPKVVRDQLDEDAYTVSGPDGEEIGELENRQSAPSSAIARYLKGKTLAQREIVLLEFDLLAAEARLTITSEGQLPEHVAKLDGRFPPAQDRPE